MIKRVKPAVPLNLNRFVFVRSPSQTGEDSLSDCLVISLSYAQQVHKKC